VATPLDDVTHEQIVAAITGAQDNVVARREARTGTHVPRHDDASGAKA